MPYQAYTEVHPRDLRFARVLVAMCFKSTQVNELTSLLHQEGHLTVPFHRQLQGITDARRTV